MNSYIGLNSRGGLVFVLVDLVMGSMVQLDRYTSQPCLELAWSGLSLSC